MACRRAGARMCRDWVSSLVKSGYFLRGARFSARTHGPAPFISRNLGLVPRQSSFHWQRRVAWAGGNRL